MRTDIALALFGVGAYLTISDICLMYKHQGSGVTAAAVSAAMFIHVNTAIGATLCGVLCNAVAASCVGAIAHRRCTAVSVNASNHANCFVNVGLPRHSLTCADRNLRPGRRTRVPAGTFVAETGGALVVLRACEPSLNSTLVADSREYWIEYLPALCFAVLSASNIPVPISVVYRRVMGWPQTSLLPTQA